MTKILKRVGKWLGIVALGLLALLVVAALVSGWANQRLPTASPVVDHLDDLDKARLAEVIHLRQTLGDTVWPGWGEATIPLILYNEEYAFLVGLSDPPPGWVTVPGGERRGGPWEAVPGEQFEGQIYYRQKLPADVTPQAFTVRVGEQWAASLITKEWMEIELIGLLRGQLPPVLDQVFPYRLFVGEMLKGSDGHIAALLHEAFHAYAGIMTPERLIAAERTIALGERAYPWDDDEVRAAWQAELDLLADALRAGSDADARDLARQFLQQRSQRRTDLAPDLVDYERQREWAEGLAKYTELAIWRAAATTPGYQPLAALADDPDFHAYRTFDRKWNQEIDQIRRMAGDEGDGRFYYSGMAQAALLDRLAPGWKTQILSGDLFLEDLLTEAILGSTE